MEVFISNLQPHVTQESVEEWLTPILERFEIRVFDLRKKRGKKFANLTVTDATKAQKLIDNAWTIPEVPQAPRTGKRAHFSVSKNAPDSLLLKILRKDEKDWHAHKLLPDFGKKDHPTSTKSKKSIDSLSICSIECGRWEARSGQTDFVSFFKFDVNGMLIKRGRALVAKMSPHSSTSCGDIVFDYFNIQQMTLSKLSASRSLVLTLEVAPKVNVQQSGHDVLSLMLGIDLTLLDDTKTSAVRTSFLPGCHELIAGCCLIYKLNLQPEPPTHEVQSTMKWMTSNQVPLSLEDSIVVQSPTLSFVMQVVELEKVIEAKHYSFMIRFQLECLWRNSFLSPSEVCALVPIIEGLLAQGRSDRDVAAALRFLSIQLIAAGPGVPPTNADVQRARSVLSQSADMIYPTDYTTNVNEVSIHRVTVTPAGVYLFGPERDTANRVIRQFAGHENCFLRVSFAEESGEKIRFDADASNEKIFRERFQSILQQGLSIAGKHFDFLGFSHSSLRSQTCWFMSPFVHVGSNLTARQVIKSLGDFSDIRCPAKCAARIGQAFSDTEKSITVDTGEVCTVPDVQSGRFTFTDGCGTISPLLWKSLRKSATRRIQATLYQVRFQGAKGMLSLDTRLSGRQMCLRPSMIKFNGSPSNDLEICGTNARPLPFKLNRPLVKILEDLGVKYDAFETVQAQAVEVLKRSARSTKSAVDFLCSNLSDNPTGIADVVRCLAEQGLEVTEDQFIREIIRALIEVQLREIKFRTRIPVSQAVTLYGISDETGFLQEGQIYVTFTSVASEHDHLQGRVAVTRSPALHPGDVQIAMAVIPPSDSPLLSLTNCVVFSQKGNRDLPSMLGGGDLDGDLFNIIYDSDLLPLKSDRPADYPPVVPVDIGRPVTSNDMAKFFVDFMESDQLGRIATLHQVYADQQPDGTRSDVCLKLAGLHSAAVDFSKSGQPVNMKEIPKTPVCRPDFMAPSASVKVHRGIKEAEETFSAELEDSQRFRYYESDRILGRLFRSINEDDFFDDLQDDDVSIFSREGTDDIIGQIWKLVLEHVSDDDWKTYLDMAQQVKNYYNCMIWEIMTQYAVQNTHSLTEKEVLIGSIIGRSGSGSAHQREQTELMKARYKREVQGIRQWMKTQTEDDADGYLSLAIACLSLYTSDGRQSTTRFGSHLRSFAWFAAGVCVPKLLAPSDRLKRPQVSIDMDEWMKKVSAGLTI